MHRGLATGSYVASKPERFRPVNLLDLAADLPAE